MKPKLIFIAGPTAVGKTAVAIHLAKKIDGEIISCDSMQIYKGMKIISSQPSVALQRKIPHHLVNKISPAKEYNVSQYRKQSLKEIENIAKRGKVPIFVGGTGLYMSVLINGIFELKTEDPVLRQKLYQQAEAFGSSSLYKRLKEVDPEAALKIHPNDTRRIVRALEVFLTTGKPISVLQKQRHGLSDKFEISIFCLNSERSILQQRIEARINAMFKQGLVDEVKMLLQQKVSKTASVAIGIKELKGYLEGLYDLDQAKQQMKRNTWQYARRQLTWFRKDKRTKWINLREQDKPREIAQKLWKKLY